jgi:8-oxo-dGTP diphosphatase
MNQEYAYNAVVIFCYIIKNNEVLLIKRNKPPDENKYTVVGGKKERGEDLSAACKREVFEESSLVLESVNFRGVINFNIEGYGFETMAFYFMSDEFSGEPVSSAEGELEWCNIEDSFMKDGVSDFYIKISPFVFKQDKNFIGLIRVNKNGEITNLNIF